MWTDFDVGRKVCACTSPIVTQRREMFRITQKLIQVIFQEHSEIFRDVFWMVQQLPSKNDMTKIYISFTLGTQNKLTNYSC